jgi:membrane-bound inhibitor of C-type lysozyme
VPTSAAAKSSSQNVCANASINNPQSVSVMPSTSEYGCGRRSMTDPTTGWSTDAVT